MRKSPKVYGEIYIKAENKVICEVLELIKERIGKEVRIVDLKPNYENK